MSKLNEEYFKTKQVYKANYKKQTLSFKRQIINFIIAFVLIVVCDFLLKQCCNKIEQNKNLEKVNETQN